MTEHVKHYSGKQEFADRLRSAMFDSRIGAEKLAATSGVSMRLVKKYLSGEVAPIDYFGDPKPNAHKLAETLGIPVDTLVPPAADAPEPSGAAA